MGFLLTLAYVLLSLLSPLDLFPSLAVYRIELLLVFVTLIFSAPNLLDSRFFRIPQIYLLLGMFAAVFLSVAIGERWVGGGLAALQEFLPAAIVLYLVVLNCRSVQKLRILLSLLVVVGLFYVVQGARAYLAGDVNSPLLEVIPVSDGSVTFRMQGLGFLRDPNELAQFLVMVIPFLWIRWRPGSHLRNLGFVIAPSLLSVWGIYLTHSRGAVVALVVILMFALKGRVRLTYSVLGGALAFAALLALNLSGGRDISLEAGSDRLQLWGDGLGLFLQSPLFGIGYVNFAGENHGHTAHNSFIVCLAELGIIGYAFWVGLVGFTISGLNWLISRSHSEAGNADATDAANGRITEESAMGDADVHKLATALRISLLGFLSAAFFLSRAYVLTLYLMLGLAIALLRLTSEADEPGAEQPMSRLIGVSAGLGVAAILVVYLTLRLRSVL